ncbi:MAG: biotin/lipoyl-binding protein [Halanaerobiaceae bacterium]|nr:biotin/lipoyl-binding protein [Halanaerobiaceae bacterium]
MKKYKVRVNDKVYEVEVEEISSATSATEVEKEEEKEDVVKAAQTQTTAENISGEKVLAPLPGTITGIQVKVGDQVEAGDVLFIMEAMKMENEIPSPVSGTVKAIHVTKNAAVDTGELLETIG